MITLPIPVVHHPDSNIPFKASEGAAAFDLTARETHDIYPGEVVKFPTGLKMAIPKGYAGLILPRSGLAANVGLRPANTPGLIDSDYRGEIIVALENFGARKQTISLGTRVAQLLVIQVPDVNLMAVESLNETTRGEGGFGSTGDYND